ncbi:MAG: arylesterase [SAR324 cluster bacterium]|nr:arylesterase [SAR324 cluster bacterium]
MLLLLQRRFSFYWGICLFIILWSNSLYAQDTVTILCLGDSLTEGYGIDRTEAYPYLVERAFQAQGHQHVKVINAGISGSTSASALSRLKWYLRIKPDILVLALGANDGLRGLDSEAMKKNLASTIKLALDAEIRVVLAGMKMPPNYGIQYAESFAAVYPRLAEEHKIHLIPFLLDGVAGHPELNLPDGIHPNPQGHKIIADMIFQHLSPLLPSS